MAVCCPSVSITADLLDAYQDIPFGTPAQDKSYGRRNPSEKTISMIKDKGGLKAGWCRAFGLAAHTIGVLALTIAHNLKQTIGIERTQTQKPRRPARPKSFEPTGRNILVKTTNIPGRLSKTWSQRIRIHGRETNLGLGSYPAVTLAEARRRALRNRQSVEEGHNPRSGQTPTFQQAAAKVIELHSGKWRPGSRSQNIWESSLQTYVFPHIGRKQVDEVTSKDIMKCLTPIWHSKPETARRVQQRIGAIMKWAVAEGFLESDPSAAILAGLGKNSTRRSHMRALHHSNVGAAIRTVESSNAHWATIAAFKILTLTATRSGEVRNATWDEIDLTTDIWEVPGERTKTGRPHRVPLSSPARNILDIAADLTDTTGLVFPSPTGKPLSNSTMSKLVRENGIDAVPHGMRSSFRDWCRDSGVPREIAEAALAHIVGGVEGAYARSDLLEARRPIMEKWAHYLET